MKSVYWIQLTRGLQTQIDGKYMCRVWEHKYHAASRGDGRGFYAGRMDNENRRVVSLVEDLFGPAGPGLTWDHKNGDPLDNREENLRRATAGEQQHGFRRKMAGASSRYRGVCRKPQGRPWEANIRFNGKLQYLGTFDTENEAAAAYNRRAHELGFSVNALNIINEL